MRLKYTSLVSGGLFQIATLLTPGAATHAAMAAQIDTAPMPMLFDSRERLPRPDLSNLVRFRVLTSTDFPPFNFADQTGRLSGFHVDLIREICAELNIEAKCQIQALAFSDLEEALESGQGEAVIAGISVTEALRRKFDFSRPYMMLPARFVRNKATKGKGEDIRALNGQTVGVVEGTAHQAMLSSFFPRMKASLYENRGSLLDGLRKGEIGAAFADAQQLSFWVNSKSSESCCELFGAPYFSERFLGEGLTVMVRDDDATLRQAIDSALSTLSRKGRLQDIYLRYFPYGLYGERADATAGQDLR